MYYNFGKDIQYAKIVLGMSEMEIAKFIGVSRMTVNRWMSNKVIPSYELSNKMYNKYYEAGIYLNNLKIEMYNSSIKENHILLFHGAKAEIIDEPSIKYSDENKDFGKGFYLGESFDQSASFVVNYEESSIYIFDFNKTKIKLKEFSVSREWMLLIAYFRGRLIEFKNSTLIKKLLNDLQGIDVIIAPIADNTMYTVLDEFISGRITDLQCLNALSANRLGRQYVFLNDKAIKSSLKMIERCFYCDNERNDFKAYRLKEK